MKKVLTLLLAGALVFSLAACTAGNKEAEPSDEPQGSTEESPLPQQDAVSYDELIDKYHTALKDGWGGDKLIEEDMSLLLLDKTPDAVGYCVLDIDNDGADELLIGSVTGEAYPDQMIYDLYTLKDEQIVHVISGQERSRYYLTRDEAAPEVYFLYNEGSSGAADSSYVSMHLENGELKADQAVIQDSAADSENPWFSGTMTGGALTKGSAMDTDTAEGIVSACQSSVAALPCTPFADD